MEEACYQRRVSEESVDAVMVMVGDDANAVVGMTLNGDGLVLVMMNNGLMVAVVVILE